MITQGGAGGLQSILSQQIATQHAPKESEEGTSGRRQSSSYFCVITNKHVCVLQRAVSEVDQQVDQQSTSNSADNNHEAKHESKASKEITLTFFF
jgi:hypothetical protein